jgi:hypothetical protein
MINALTFSVGIPEEKRPHGRPKYRWNNNNNAIKLQETEYEGVHSIHRGVG